MKNVAKTDLAKAIVFDSLFNHLVDENGDILGSPTQFDKIDYSAGLINSRGEATVTVKCLKIGGVLYEFYAKFDCSLNRVFWKSCMVTRSIKPLLLVSCFNFIFHGLWDTEEEGDAVGVQDTDSVEAVEDSNNTNSSGYEF